jgi:hypothetical protein
MPPVSLAILLKNWRPPGLRIGNRGMLICNCVKFRWAAVSHASVVMVQIPPGRWRAESCSLAGRNWAAR